MVGRVDVQERILGRGLRSIPTGGYEASRRLGSEGDHVVARKGGAASLACGCCLQCRCGRVTGQRYLWLADAGSVGSSTCILQVNPCMRAHLCITPFHFRKRRKKKIVPSRSAPSRCRRARQDKFPTEHRGFSCCNYKIYNSYWGINKRAAGRFLWPTTDILPPSRCNSRPRTRHGGSSRSCRRRRLHPDGP